MCKTYHILFIGHLWPEPDSSAAGYRTMALLEACLQLNWQVSFASAAEETLWSEDLRAIGVSCYSIKLNSQNFDQWITELNPDYCVYDRFMTEEQFSWRVEKYCSDCIQILDTCDLHFLRRSRQKAQKKKINNTSFNSKIDFFSNENSEDSIRELSSIYRSDLSLIISSYEMALLKKDFQLSDDLLLYLPFMLDFPHPLQSPDLLQKQFSQRQHFFMIGNFLHQPNWDAVLWCKQTLWPKIRASIPDAQLHVFGAYTPEKARQLQQTSSGFYIMGRAENLPQLISSYRVNLVPLRFGAGIKGKIADGFQFGLPCITTSIGAEGMSGNLPWGGYICDNEDDFIQSAIKLYANADIWQKKQSNGYEIIKYVHNKQINQQSFINALLELKQNIAQQRKKNFIGSMLKYHLHRSHEFMSRWIEEKNK
jgi:glycosyltransferase involved in cell wall biosynthesis